jgi:hypothetical protein
MSRRHLIIPDTQVRPGVDTSHIDWASRAIVDYKPDVVVHLGDHWDMPSLNSHARVGEMEGQRVMEDIRAGNLAFKRLIEPMEAEITRRVIKHRKRWTPELHFLIGNHEDRISRAVKDNPTLEGILTLDNLETYSFQRHSFLEIVEIDGIHYSHYFANTHSGRPIGGSIDNRLNKIGRSFVQGHEQGFLYGCRQFPGDVTRHGLVAGSFYLHDESYRGAQSNGEWRGIVILNEVHDGKYDIMPLSMDYLRRKYSQ